MEKLVEERIIYHKDGTTEAHIIVYLSHKHRIATFIVIDEACNKHTFSEQELRKQT